MAKRGKGITDSGPTLFEMGKAEQVPKAAEAPVARPYDIPNLHLGTSSFQAQGWQGIFYPKGMKPGEYLTHYAQTFRTVEIDSSFYGTPTAATVNSWYAKTPVDFLISAKVPQIITHEKALEDCDQQWREFVETMGLLREKRGAMLLQFPWFNQYQFKSGSDFVQRLRGFLKKLPDAADWRFAVEIRNPDWIEDHFLGALREHNVALVLTDTSFLPRPWEWKKPLDVVTSDFLYVRWLGNRKQIEQMTTTWEHTIVDRRRDLQCWVELLRSLVLDKRIRKILAYSNNHYAGYAPDTAKLFFELWSGEKSR